MEIAYQTETVQGQIWVDDDGLVKAGDDPGGIATGGEDVDGAGGEFVTEGVEDAADHAAITDGGTGEDGFGGGLADGVGGLAEGDLGEEGGALMEVVGHEAEAGGDDAADVVFVGGEDVEGDGGAEVDDDARGAVEVGEGDGVGEAVGADGFGFGVTNADAHGGVMAEFDELGAEDGAEGGNGVWDDGAEDGLIEVPGGDEFGDGVWSDV